MIELALHTLAASISNSLKLNIPVILNIHNQSTVHLTTLQFDGTDEALNEKT